MLHLQGPFVKLNHVQLVFCSTTPIESAWRNAAAAKHRFDFNTWYLSYSALSIFFDVVILCFPIPMIKSLSINTRKKISILGIFWLGGFVCVSAVIRFVLLYKYIYKLQDYGRNDYSSVTSAFIWAEIEPNVSVVAACLPTYGPLFRAGAFFPTAMRSLRSILGMSSKSKTPSGSPNSNPDGYYEIDRTISSKNTGEILKTIDSKPDTRSKDEFADV